MRLRTAKNKYAAALTQLAKIHWDLKDFQHVEELFAESLELCKDSTLFKVNQAHAVYMQEGKHAEAVKLYEEIVQEQGGDLLKAEAIVLANLCVSYILTKQNAKAEELIQRVQTQE